MTPSSGQAHLTSDSPSATSLVLSSPQALIAGVPYLLGFTPQDSTVFVWLRQGRIHLTQRMDAQAFAAGADAWTSSVWGHQGAREADEVVLIHFAEAPPPQAMLDSFTRQATQRGVIVKDLLSVIDQRWRSAMCADVQCCPAQGRRIDESVLSAVGAEFAVMGVAPRTDRTELVAELAPMTPPDQMAQRISRIRAARPRRARDLERWRERAIRRIIDIQLPMSSVDIDFVTAGLSDIRVRDTVLWECAHTSADRLLALLSAMQTCTRAAPSGFAAPVSTCTAVVAWLLGDGARAGIALDRALDDRSDYSLALLVRRAIATGLPPRTWRQAMESVTREECRHGRR